MWSYNDEVKSNLIFLLGNNVQHTTRTFKRTVRKQNKTKKNVLLWEKKDSQRIIWVLFILNTREMTINFSY